ncbi:hypothetical protein J2851_007088 [Azospirillum rugosum]|uniref:Transposase n=1 Tax=Azospirillum rugosum TaxID=416170 RepID=A0ABS4SXQ3_9PROT|nr:hypothetical protein [Azospirillum rugosum]MDQ0531098.1 hypothetical protein [Azospirillum rugosum]
MDLHVGLDVSLDMTSVCVVDGAGKVVWRRCSSTRDAIAVSVPIGYWSIHIPDTADEFKRCARTHSPFRKLSLTRVRV